MQLSPLTKYLIYQLNTAISLLPKMIAEGKRDDLHQFRVAIRRVRSLLKLYLENTTVFPPMLKNLVKQTNHLREIDVLLSTIKRTRYPKIYKRLSALRKEYFQSVFTDAFKHEAILELTRYYHELHNLKPDNKPEQWISMAKEHYQKCIDEYRILSQNTPKKELHALRIRFKTARYALEFLNESALSGEKEKISTCKGYQEVLGAIQDTYNQISWLEKFYKNNPIKETKELIRKRRKKLKELKKARGST